MKIWMQKKHIYIYICAVVIYTLNVLSVGYDCFFFACCHSQKPLPGGSGVCGRFLRPLRDQSVAGKFCKSSFQLPGAWIRMMMMMMRPVQGFCSVQSVHVRNCSRILTWRAHKSGLTNGFGVTYCGAAARFAKPFSYCRCYSMSHIKKALEQQDWLDKIWHND